MASAVSGHAAVDAFGSRPPLPVRPPRALAVFWMIAGAAGWIVSFLLYLEYFADYLLIAVTAQLRLGVLQSLIG
ncbi:hypothetical protein ELQ92_05435 [Labedella populi]|uniref:Uncharacterized protein n=1 Tax=Labedella populi TaxID=2498850 RepID=A0A444QGD2_9MICO|nr:hypothetical protein [Labedella populi]RWZ68642.1 hypothetical protein ELQ92_05435 [Labedella populi]